MGNLLPKIKEHYIIKDEEADFYNMKGKGPFMVDSFGRKYIKPSLQPFGYGYPGRYTLRAGQFYHTPDVRHMNRLQRASTYSPLAYTTLQNYYDYYPNYPSHKLFEPYKSFEPFNDPGY